MKPLELQLKELLGVEEYNRFAETVLFPAIQQLAESGKLSNSDLAKLARLTKTYGAGIFDVAATDLGDATKHNLTDGFSVIARYRLNDDLEFKLFVKKFSDRKSYERGVTIQEEIAKSLKGTELEGIVPDQVYKNPKKRIVMMPLVEAQSLSAALPESEAEKEELLKRTVAEYLKVADHVETKKLFVPPDRNIFGKIWYDDFKLPSLQDFDRFFARNFGADGELAESYRKHIGSRLNGNTSDFVHGDLHPGNILVNGRIHFIDWELAANGFKEFDLYKLFTKSGVNGDLEDRLLEFAGASRERYRLNQVTQDLLTAERYSKRAKQDSKRSEKLERMALTAYNIALRHIERAEAEGILDPKFRQVLERHVASNKPYSRVSGVEFEKLLLEYNPHTTASQENLVTQGTAAPSVLDNDSRQKNLETIRKSLHKKDWGKIAKLGTAAALFIGLTGSLAGFGLKNIESQHRRELSKQKSIVINDSSYEHNFRGAYDILLSGDEKDSYIHPFTYSKIKFNSLTPSDPVVKESCDKFDIEYGLVKNMLIANSLVGGVDRTRMHYRGIFIFDPYQIWASMKFDPVDNLHYGVERLSILFDKYGVDKKAVHATFEGGPFNNKWKSEDRAKIPGLKEALARFYFDRKNFEKGVEDEEYDKRLLQEGLPRPVKSIIYTIMHNGPLGDMIGDSLWYAPDDFMSESKFGPSIER